MLFKRHSACALCHGALLSAIGCKAVFLTSDIELSNVRHSRVELSDRCYPLWRSTESVRGTCPAIGLSDVTLLLGRLGRFSTVIDVSGYNAHFMMSVYTECAPLASLPSSRTGRPELKLHAIHVQTV